MWGIIKNIINSYDMQAEALSVLVANTRKALDQSERQRKADERLQRVENFVKGLSNMLTRFYWLKERKKRQHKEMTPDQVKAMVDFAHWVKSLTGKIGFVLEYFQKSPTFEEKIDRDIKELEAHIKAEFKKFNKVLEVKPDTLTIHLGKYANILSGTVRKLFTQRRFSILKSKQLMHTKQPEEQLYGNKD
jgi:hypothetical protein